ncbi:MAG: glycosyltransferase family 2 protein, partial [Patescibacteria group bacterium]|nr:glycosyltransferase family 2 protein [Patescibacteria group bacterium]
MNQPKVAVIIINWNGKYLLEECLNSVENQDYNNYKIVFVDNGSEDGSVEFVKEKFPKIEIISLDKNTGFAKGNNIGIHKAFEDSEVEYIALLNNDAMTERSWLSEMVRIIRQDDKIGSVAPKILKHWRRDEIDSIGIKIRFNGGGVNIGANEKDKKQYDNIEEVFGTTGCSCLYKRKMLEDIVMDNNNYFDNDFFAFCEDVDLAWRARLRGWKSFTSPES